MPERIPDTAQDFFNAMRAEFVEALRQIKDQQEQYFLEILELLGAYNNEPVGPEESMPEWKPGMVLPTPTVQDNPVGLSFESDQLIEEVTQPQRRMTREEIAHNNDHHDGRGFRMSCEFCRDEKYSVDRNK